MCFAHCESHADVGRYCVLLFPLSGQLQNCQAPYLFLLLQEQQQPQLQACMLQHRHENTDTYFLSFTV